MLRGPKAAAELACVIAHIPLCLNILYKAASDQLIVTTPT